VAQITNKDIAIYIPSAGRGTRQFTLQRIPPAYRDITYLVVPKDQRFEYDAHAGRCAGVLACPKNGIGKTRQWILDTTKRKFILLLDDDMYFYHRIKKGDWHLATNDMNQNKEMLDELFAYLIDDKFIHIGMATRTEASFYLCSYRTCTRVNNVHGFNVVEMRKHAPSFAELPVMEDFNVTLNLLRAGFPNKVLLDFVWNQPGSNADGGCSTYRTQSLQSKAAHALAALHPKFVKVVEKKVVGTTSWEGMKTRTDVRIAWHKAWLDAGKGEHKHWAKERKALRK
jgi:TET-associated glycosyltransferase-like protein